MTSTITNKYSTFHKLALEGLVWITLLIIAWWWTLSITNTNFKPVLIYISTLSLLAGIRTFLGHGAERITATGLFSLSTAMFIGLSGILLTNDTPPRAGWDNLALACVSGLTAQVFTSILSWRPTGFYTTKPLWFDDSTASWILRAGWVSLVVATIFRLALPDFAAYSAATAFSAICILTSGLFLRKSAAGFVRNSIIILATSLLYIEFFHSGTGRLHIVALACSITFLMTVRFPYKRLKIAIVFTIPFAMIWMAIDRLALEQSLGSRPDAERTGLESMTAPLKIFSTLIQTLRAGDLDPSLGYNLLSVPALFIPKSIWPTQPNALGYELVWFDDPGRYGDGIFSTVATSTGEGIFNFGWMGIPIVIVFSVIVLRTFDAKLNHHLNFNKKTILSMLSLILLAMLIGAIADYTWSGVHTYSARTLTRLPIFLLVVLCAAISISLRTQFNGVRNLTRPNTLRP